MNPLDPKISHAIKEIETVYAGQESAHGYFDPKNRIYVLIVSGGEAEGYHNAVKALHDLAAHARRHAADRAN